MRDQQRNAGGVSDDRMCMRSDYRPDWPGGVALLLFLVFFSPSRSYALCRRGAERRRGVSALAVSEPGFLNRRPFRALGDSPVSR